MLRFGPMAASAALLLSANIPGALPLRPSTNQPIEFPATENLPVLPELPQAKDENQDTQQANPSDANSGKSPDKSKDEPLQPESRLMLVRSVDFELVRAVETLPAGKNGFHLKAGAPLDDRALRNAVASYGSAINPGDKAQISALQIKEREIVVDINGGGRGGTRLRDRIQVYSGMPTMTTVPDTPVVTKVGSTIHLDFDTRVPDMTPDQLKRYLSVLLDFSRQHSAAVQWMTTLPPDIQKAITDNRAAVGMDHEMVLAALGRPDRKVREKSPDGNETEDWIYGRPPAKTVFVTFEGDKVTQVEQFPR